MLLFNFKFCLFFANSSNQQHAYLYFLPAAATYTKQAPREVIMEETLPPAVPSLEEVTVNAFIRFIVYHVVNMC